MKSLSRACTLSLVLAVNLAWAQVPLGKEQATSLVTQVLSERGVALQSADDAGTRFKSAPFAFDSDSGVHYVGCYTFTVANGGIKVTVTDAAGAIRTEAMSIAVTNVNEAPISISLSSSSVLENAAGAVGIRWRRRISLVKILEASSRAPSAFGP